MWELYHRGQVVLCTVQHRDLTNLLKWIRPFLMKGSSLKSFIEKSSPSRKDSTKASGGIRTMYSLLAFSSLNCGLIACSHSPFIMSLIPALLRRSHLLPSRSLHICSNASSTNTPPQRPPMVTRGSIRGRLIAHSSNVPVPSTASCMVIGST